jgi:hypothetical protein
MRASVDLRKRFRMYTGSQVLQKARRHPRNTSFALSLRPLNALILKKNWAAACIDQSWEGFYRGATIVYKDAGSGKLLYKF